MTNISDISADERIVSIPQMYKLGYFVLDLIMLAAVFI